MKRIGTKSYLRPFIAMRILTFLIAIVAVCPSVYSMPDISSSKFMTANGLSDNTVRRVFQDSKGYLWFATLNGLSRYDGYSFTSYVPLDGTLSTKVYQIRDISEDSSGLLWIVGSNNQVSCFDPSVNESVRFLPKEGSWERYRHVKLLPDGTVWLWGDAGARRVIPKKDREGLKSQYFSKSNGKLPGEKVLRISQDHLGRILISTDKGLVAYNKDGTIMPVDKTRTYQWIMPTESRATLLVATNGDIVKIDSRGQLSVIYKISGVNSADDLPGSFHYGGYWYVSAHSGGVGINLQTLSVKKLPFNEGVTAGRAIMDNEGDFWLFNGKGVLWHYNTKNDRLTPLHLIPDTKLRLVDEERYTVSRDKNGLAWITTGVNGLYLYNPASGALDHITAAAGNYSILTTDNLLSSIIDRQGNIWIGTESGGALMLRVSNHGVKPLTLPSSDNRPSRIRMIKKIKGGMILITTQDGYMYRFSPDLKQVYASDRGMIITDIARNRVTGDIYEASREDGIIVNGRKASASEYPLSSNQIFTIHTDSEGRIWVGTFGKGLDVLIPDKSKAGKYRRLNFLKGSYGQSRIREIYGDTKGMIWVCTNEGAYRIDPRTIQRAGGPEITAFTVESGALRSNETNCVTEDRHGRIWIGEANCGISVLDFSKSKNKPECLHIGFEEGLGHNNVQSFVRQSGKYIWAATAYGVSRINPENLSVRNFVFLSSPTSNIHTSNSSIMLDNGWLVFGTARGAYMVALRNIEEKAATNPITVTKFCVNGKVIPFAEQNGVEVKDGVYRVTLPHDENDIDIDLSTFDFQLPKQTKFRYKLLPDQKEWTNPTADNHLSFKGLNPGKYRLIVEAAGDDGNWNRKIEIELIISAPWWASGWARCVYVLLILGGAYLIVGVIRRMNELHNKAKVEEQLTDYKLEFFTNISHEFRTPLTLIQASLEKIHDKLSYMRAENPKLALGGIYLSLSTLDKSSRRMSRLIDELLTFRKVEKDKLVLYPESTEIVGFLKDIFTSFKDEALFKHIDFRFSSNPDEFQANVDRNALEKIANNLISNALKYTRECGVVSMSVTSDPTKNTFSIHVSDNGVGIPPEKKEQLFSRFMQSAMSRNSIGVGLHLTFGLVGLHKGTIHHTDNPGGGSIFTVTLPTDMPVAKKLPEEGIGRPIFDNIFEDESKESEEKQIPDRKDLKRLLIIDDDADIRQLLSTEFSSAFTILTASDGHSGLEVARNNEVNLIICDVMMPDMSGFEVTRRLKEDFATSHIPIIQLTALSDDDCHIEGISSGADAYVTKPFNLRFLKIRAAKLVEQRENLFSKFSATPTLAHPQLPIGDKDKKFAEKLSEIVEKQLDNFDYSVEDLAADLAMGRTLLFRKVKGVTGYSPKEYMRVVRMKRAAEMLLTTTMSIKEISYSVGISDPAYFNRCFKAQFGKAPSIYQKENTEPTKDTEQLPD